MSWKTENGGLSPQGLAFNLIKLIWGKLENKLDSCIVDSKESHWFEWEKVWDNISV